MDPSWPQLLASLLGGIILLGTAVKAWPGVWSFIKGTAKLPTTAERIVRLADIAEELMEMSKNTQGVVLATKEMDEYLHTRVHEVLTIVAKDKSWAQILVDRLDKIEARLDASERGDERVAEHLIVSEREHRQAAADITEHIDRVHDEVRTGNALSMGALADDEETRRILLKRPADRTPAEQEHLRQVPGKENPI